MDGICEGKLSENLGQPTQMFEYHLKRRAPQINGSVGAFIAVVVCLVIIIVVSCTAIVYLLREEHLFDVEHGRRRKSAPYSTSSNVREQLSDKPSIGSRLFSLIHFGRKGDAHQNDHGRALTHGSGWMQARSGDEWDYYPDTSIQAEASSSSPAGPLSPPVLPMPVSRSTSKWSVHFDLNAIRGSPRLDRQSPSTQAILPDPPSTHSSPIYSPTESPIQIPVLSPALDPIQEGASIHSAEIRPFSTSSGVMQTLPGGTKFVEDL